jgi:hypothetical protein
MSTLATMITMIGATLAIVSLAVGLQTFWINRSLGRVEDAVKDTRTELKGDIARLDTGLVRLDAKVDAGLARLDARLDELKTEIVRDHGERIAKLEALVHQP